MASDDDEYVTKGYLRAFEDRLQQRFDAKFSKLDSKIDNLRVNLTKSFDTKLDRMAMDVDTKLDGLAMSVDTKLETIRDQIIRAFEMTEENIRQDHAHVDELASLETRVAKIEKHLAIDEH